MRRYGGGRRRRTLTIGKIEADPMIPGAVSANSLRRAWSKRDADLGRARTGRVDEAVGQSARTSNSRDRNDWWSVCIYRGRGGREG